METQEVITLDDKGRPNVESMSNTELLRELVRGQRQLADALQAAMSNPMVRAMMPGLNL
jgi:hypothetical protein